jgi:hypothetical protein
MLWHWLKISILLIGLGIVLMISVHRLHSSTPESEQSITSTHGEQINQAKSAQATAKSVLAPNSVAASTTTTLPSGVIPLMQLRDMLERRADAGDVAAATRLAHDATNCANADYEISWMQGILERAPKEIRPQTIELRRQQWEELPGKIAAAQKTQRAVCTGVRTEEAWELARRSTLQAAQLGDADSQLCALTLHFVDRYNEPVITDYQEQGFARGDWRIVRLMALRTISGGRGQRIGGRISSPPDPSDPVTYYRMLSLLRLGASAGYAKDLDDEIDTYNATNSIINSHGGTGLSSAQAIEAEAWAQDQFQKHFALSPRMNREPGLCGEF